MPPKEKAEAVSVAELSPEQMAQELTLLRGFRDLVGERWGYFLGRKVKQTEMNEATKKERKTVNEIRKGINEHFESFIEGNESAEDFISFYSGKTKELTTARKEVAKKAKPYREKIKPLRQAQTYLDSVAIPDALKELGQPVQPRFSLSKWINEALQAEKQK